MVFNGMAEYTVRRGKFTTTNSGMVFNGMSQYIYGGTTGIIYGTAKYDNPVPTNYGIFRYAASAPARWYGPDPPSLSKGSLFGPNWSENAQVR